MSIHISVYGSFKHRVEFYADLDGFIPEAGDSAGQFRYHGTQPWEEDEDLNPPTPDDAAMLWNEWVNDAVDAARDANTGVAEWRAETRGCD